MEKMIRLSVFSGVQGNGISSVIDDYDIIYPVHAPDSFW